LARVLDEKHGVLTELGDPAAARQAEHGAALLREELGLADAPEPAASPADRLDDRLAALRLDEREYRRAGRKVLLAQTLVEQAYHWAILRRFPLAAKPLADEAGRRARRCKLHDLLAEFQPVLQATGPSVEQLAGERMWRARPAIIRPLAAALALGAYGAYLLFLAAGQALPELSGGRSPDVVAYVMLLPGLVLAVYACRNIHGLFLRPYLILTPMGLALRQWRQSESSIYRALGQLFLPFRFTEHTAVAWSELRGCRVEAAIAGFFSSLIIEADWGEVKVGRVFHETPARLAGEILGTRRKFVTPKHPARELDPPWRVGTLNPTHLAVWSLVSGMASFLCLPVLGVIPAIILGHRALSEARVSGGGLGGKVMARMGLALGYLNLSLFVVLAVIQLYKAFTR
jgi:hypothetical protein